MSPLPVTSPDSAELQGRIERFQKVHADILDRSPQGDRRPGRSDRAGYDRPVRRRPLPDHRLAGHRENTARAHAFAKPWAWSSAAFSSRPDLMPSDITGTDIIEEDPVTGHRSWTFVPGPIFRQRPAGGRNQPHPAQDAIRAARSDAGALLHGARHAAQDQPAVLRARHAEPDRARRHLSSARSAARPLHLQYAARLPLRRRRNEGARPDHHHPPGASGRRSPTPKKLSTSSKSCAWFRSPIRSPATPSIWSAPRAPPIPPLRTSSRST